MAMPCPSCAAPRIGNRRGGCRVCNSFAQAVARATLRALRAEHPETFAALRSRVEREVYRQRYHPTVVRSSDHGGR